RIFAAFQPTTGQLPLVPVIQQKHNSVALQENTLHRHRKTHLAFAFEAHSIRLFMLFTLDLLPQSFERVEIAALCGERLDAPEAALELGGSMAQCCFRVDIELPGEVG